MINHACARKQSETQGIPKLPDDSDASDEIEIANVLHKNGPKLADAIPITSAKNYVMDHQKYDKFILSN